MLNGSTPMMDQLPESRNGRTPDSNTSAAALSVDAATPGGEVIGLQWVQSPEYANLPTFVDGVQVQVLSDGTIVYPQCAAMPAEGPESGPSHSESLSGDSCTMTSSVGVDSDVFFKYFHVPEEVGPAPPPIFDIGGAVGRAWFWLCGRKVQSVEYVNAAVALDEREYEAQFQDHPVTVVRSSTRVSQRAARKAQVIKTWVNKLRSELVVRDATAANKLVVERKLLDLFRVADVRIETRAHLKALVVAEFFAETRSDQEAREDEAERRYRARSWWGPKPAAQ
nr:MAG: hypothetical protein [Chemarfal virus 165]